MTVITAFYGRVSTTQDSQAKSIDNQETLYWDKLQANGWIHYKSYQDTFTGKHTRRSGLQEMLDDAKKRRFNCIIVKNVSRLSRNITDGLEMARLLRHYGIRLLTLDGVYDSDKNKDSEVYLSWFLTMAQAEGEATSQRIKGYRRAKAVRGEFLGSIAPYGYTKVNNRQLAPAADGSEEIVKWIFSEYLQGNATTKIARMLNAKGIAPPNRNKAKGIVGHKWHDTAVRYVLKNPIYAGDLYQIRTETPAYITYKDPEKPMAAPLRKVNSEDQQVVRKGVVEAMIDPVDFLRTQEMLQKRSRPGFRPRASLFAGKARCGDCGTNMHYKKDRAYYVCGRFNKTSKCSNHKITEQRLIELITTELRQLATRALSTEDMDDFRRGYTTAVATLNQRLISLKSEHVKVERRLNTLTDSMLDGVLSREEYVSNKTRIEKERTSILQDLASLEQQLENIDDLRQQEEIFHMRIKEFLKFETLTPAVLNALVEVVEVIDSDNINIHVTFSELR